MGSVRPNPKGQIYFNNIIYNNLNIPLKILLEADWPLKAVCDLCKLLLKRLRKWRVEKIDNFQFFLQTRLLRMQLRSNGNQALTKLTKRQGIWFVWNNPSKMSSL